MRPRGVPEASRRRPRVSKKRPEGAKVDLVVFYSSKWDPEGIPEASRASKMSPNASQRRPRASRRRPRMSKKRPGGAKLDLVVFYNVFKRLYSSKWYPEGIPEASRASKMSPNASQRLPRGVQKTPKNVKEATRRRSSI